MICQSPLKKNGTTSKGTQRWRCTTCNASTTLRRPDTATRNQLVGFTSWLLGKNDQGHHSTTSARTFRRHTAWCWTISPHLRPTGQVFTELQIDGIYIRPGWCALIAVGDGKVVGWQWCDTEKSAAWINLLSQFPQPDIVLTDGGSGIFKALTTLWPTVRIQRCLVHVQRTVRRYVTMRPKTPAGKSLRALSLQLTRITTREEAATWAGLLANWHTQYKDLINERTYAKDFTGPRPHSISSTRTWWYTHMRLRSAYHALNSPWTQGHLFAFLDPHLDAHTISSTTNLIEGGVNAAIRTTLRQHRGMTIDHRRRAVEWVCWDKADPHTRPSLTQLAREQPQPQEPGTPQKPKPINDDGPVEYDKNFSWEDGNGLQQGWAGRHQ